MINMLKDLMQKSRQHLRKDGYCKHRDMEFYKRIKDK